MKKGFSIIELMVVVAIIGFLAALAIPHYFMYLGKAKQAEVAINLSSLHTAQQGYCTEHGTYKSTLAGSDGISWLPAGYSKDSKTKNFFYTYGFNVSGAKEGIHYFTGKLHTSKKYLKNTFAKHNRFIAAAAGTLIGNKVDIWVIDENRNLIHLQDGLK